MEVIETICPRDCHDTCFIRCKIDHLGKIVSIEGDQTNPITQGFICARTSKDSVRVYRNRVLYPSLY